MKEENCRITLNNGIKMPAIGLGVFQIPEDETADVVTSALSQGYRLIDTAAIYGNERQVGEGTLRSGIKRSEIFITTKLWIKDFGFDSAPRAFDASLKRLGLDYIDLYLLHWPVPSHFEATVAAYQAAEKLVADGRVRAIGVSNFNPRHLEMLLSHIELMPAVNQVELHPFFTQREVRDCNAHHGIVTQSWSPIGGVNVYRGAAPRAAKNLLGHSILVTLADKYRKSPAQIALRWHIDSGLSAIPKSVRPERLAENIDVFDFTLTRSEMDVIDGLDTGIRGGPDPELVNTQLFSRSVEE